MGVAVRPVLLAGATDWIELRIDPREVRWHPQNPVVVSIDEIQIPTDEFDLMNAVREPRENGLHPAHPAVADLDAQQTTASVATLFAALWWPVRSEGLEGIEGAISPCESEKLAGDDFRAGRPAYRKQAFTRRDQVGVAAQIALVNRTKAGLEVQGIQYETLERPLGKAVRFEHDLPEALSHGQPPAGT